MLSNSLLLWSVLLLGVTLASPVLPRDAIRCNLPAALYDTAQVTPVLAGDGKCSIPVAPTDTAPVAPVAPTDTTSVTTTSNTRTSTSVDVPSLIPPPPEEPTPVCYTSLSEDGASSGWYLRRSTLRDAVVKMCEDPWPDGELTHEFIYFEETPSQVLITATIREGNGPPSTDDCNVALGFIADNCDADPNYNTEADPKGIRDWNHGGMITVKDVDYKIEPKWPRHTPPPTAEKPIAYCDSDYQELGILSYNIIAIAGAGWLDYPYAEDTLKEEIWNSCGTDTEKWTFHPYNNGVDDLGNEFLVTFNIGGVLVDDNCIGHCLANIGGASLECGSDLKSVNQDGVVYDGDGDLG